LKTLSTAIPGAIPIVRKARTTTPVEHHFFIFEVGFSMLRLLFVEPDCIFKNAEIDYSYFKQGGFLGYIQKEGLTCVRQIQAAFSIRIGR
jgi:hypothetical protein